MKKMRKLCLCLALLLALNSFAFITVSNTGVSTWSATADDHPLPGFIWD